MKIFVNVIIFINLTCNPVFGRNIVNIMSFFEGVFVVSPFLIALLSANKASTAVLLLFLI